MARRAERQASSPHSVVPCGVMTSKLPSSRNGGGASCWLGSVHVTHARQRPMLGNAMRAPWPRATVSSLSYFNVLRLADPLCHGHIRSATNTAYTPDCRRPLQRAGVPAHNQTIWQWTASGSHVARACTKRVLEHSQKHCITPPSNSGAMARSLGRWNLALAWCVGCWAKSLLASAR